MLNPLPNHHVIDLFPWRRTNDRSMRQEYDWLSREDSFSSKGSAMTLRPMAPVPQSSSLSFREGTTR